MGQEQKKPPKTGPRKVPGIYHGVFPFVPHRAFFEKEALAYPVGRRVYRILKELGVGIEFTGSHNRVTGIPGKGPGEAFFEGKRTLVAGVRKTLDFQTCKPSAHYQLPLVTGCPGHCEYCYLHTTLGKKPYVRIYVNIDDILNRAKSYIDTRAPEVTVFEGAATSDPLAVEPFTGSLAKAVRFFAEQDKGRFRFVTKFTNVEPLLKIKHNGHTTFRFSVNARAVIDSYETGTPRLNQRIDAASQVRAAGYPLGFIIAPVIVFDGWEDEYRELFILMKDRLGDGDGITLELITHRYTLKAKKIIRDVFPATTLPMREEDRKFKYGQFGYGKYVYPKEKMKEISDFIHSLIETNLPKARIEYFI